MFDVQGLSQSLNASDYLHLKKQKYIIICKALFKLKKNPLRLYCILICRDMQRLAEKDEAKNSWRFLSRQILRTCIPLIL